MITQRDKQGRIIKVSEVGATKESWKIRKQRYGKSGSKNPSLTNKKHSEKMKGRNVDSWIKKSMDTRKQRIKEGIIRYDGEHGRNWQGGKTKAKYGLRYTLEYSKWRSAVFERDNWTCQTCGLRGVKIEAHHIKEVANYPELMLDINNGVTLCKSCHGLTKHGRNTKIYNI